MKFCYLLITVALAAVLVPAVADANARLISVTPAGNGCVYGPSGPGVQSWDVEPGQTYVITISHVFECANGGMDPMLNVRVNSSSVGNVDLVATWVAPGVYQFTYTMPMDGACTFPIFYCTTPGQSNSGLLVVRNDGVEFQAHLRASVFDVGCTNPQEIYDEYCGPVPTDDTTWGRIKALYR